MVPIGIQCQFDGSNRNSIAMGSDQILKEDISNGMEFPWGISCFKI
jgi:hypothetical protein